MAKGISLHVGINEVSPAFPNADVLVGCENDARAMHDVASDAGFYKHTVLLGPNATYARVEREVKAAAEDLEDGDIFLFTFAGHGSQEPDKSGDEPDLEDETLLLYDLMLIDDVLERDLWPRFKPGVRILMVSDSCHSGTVNSFSGTFVGASESERVVVGDVAASVTAGVEVFESHVLRPRTISEETRLAHLAAHREFYERVLNALPPDPFVGASVLLLAACGDSQTTPDGNPHGLFTKALLQVWGCGGFKGDYDAFIEAIGKELGGVQPPQTPLVTPSGRDDPVFRGQRPFFVG